MVPRTLALVEVSVLLFLLVNLHHCIVDAFFMPAGLQQGIISMVNTRSRSSAALSAKRPAVTEASPLKKTKTKKSNNVVTPEKTSGNTTDNGSNSANNNAPLLALTGNDELVKVTMLCRPSKRNRSPYVADVLVPSSYDGTTSNEPREAICHVPNLDMGGKCVPGATLYVKPAKDKHGIKLGPNAVNPKYNTPKCEFIAQLLQVEESEWGYDDVMVGAHPSLGEKIAEQLLLRNCLPLPAKVKSLQREVRNVAGTTDMRADFVIDFEQDDTSGQHHKPCVLEVKTVVDTDFEAGRIPTNRTKCVFFGPQKEGEPYKRAGIFPWGQSNQKGPDGEKVVSARAIKHVHTLTKITKKNQDYQTAILFVVIRKDAEYFRPNHEACPSFCIYLKEANDAGVHVMAKRVDWGDTPDTLGSCFEGPLLDIEFPTIHK